MQLSSFIERPAKVAKTHDNLARETPPSLQPGIGRTSESIDQDAGSKFS